jgi:hypothetical protein
VRLAGSTTGKPYRVTSGFVDSLPMTVTRKIQKYLIREYLRLELRVDEETHA